MRRLATRSTRRERRGDEDRVDREFVRGALDGDARAIDALVRRLQGPVYALALRMVWNPHDAEDATQEILVKVATALSSFRGDSAFRTWAYRLAANHLLNRRRTRAEEAVGGFEEAAKRIARTPDHDLDESVPEQRLLAEETRAGCLLGMLLCLDRGQRLAFVLGEVFETSDATASAALGITRANYRQRLARARKDLFTFMRGNCGLVDPARPCRCARKTNVAIEAGMVHPGRLRFVPARVAAVRRVTQRCAREIGPLAEAGYARLFRDMALPAPPNLAARLRSILADRRFRATLDLDR
jgi:RNA polymerase sigma factor (sigma-70 family)